MPSPIYQYVVNLVVSLTIRGGPGVFVNVPVREHRALNHQIYIYKFNLKLKNKNLSWQVNEAQKYNGIFTVTVCQLRELCLNQLRLEQYVNKCSTFLHISLK